MYCDFCNAPNPAWRFRARAFVVDYGPMTGANDAGWAACDACRDLILADDLYGLVDRAMLNAPAIPDLAESEVRELRHWSQGLSFTHRVSCRSRSPGAICKTVPVPGAFGCILLVIETSSSI